MLIGKRNRVSNSDGLLQVFRLIWTQKNHVAAQRRIRGVNVAEHLRLNGAPHPLVPGNVQLRAQLFPLVSVEDTQWNTHTDAEVLIYGRVAADIEAEDRVSRSVGGGKSVVSLGLIDGLRRSSQVGPGIQSDLAEFFQCLKLVCEVEGPRYVKLLDRYPLIQKRQELDLRRPQVHLHDVPCLVPLSAHSEHIVVIGKVVLREPQNSLGLQRLHKGVAQTKQKVSFQIGLS